MPAIIEFRRLTNRFALDARVSGIQPPYGFSLIAEELFIKPAFRDSHIGTFQEFLGQACELGEFFYDFRFFGWIEFISLDKCQSVFIEITVEFPA
jgi:hypothetical protein